MWLFPDFDELNSMMPGFGVDDLPSSGIFGLGGGGYAYIMLIDNLRIGGTGFSSSVERNAVVDGFNKKIVYSQGAGAFTAEYTLPFVKGVAVSLGAMIGGGSQSIQVFKNKGNFDWNTVWSELSESDSKSENISRELSNSYFMISPTLNVDIPLNRFIALRIGGGYLISLGDNWEMENGQILENVPSSIKTNTFFIQTGIFFGFFAF